MKTKRILCTVLACAVIVGCMGINAGASAVDRDAEISMEYEMGVNVARASGSFSMNIPANSKVRAETSFPLAAGETVRINASYSPDASVDFGLIGPDGKFHYFTVTDGNIDETIEVDQRGNYTLQIRNNSSKEISVSGYVNY